MRIILFALFLLASVIFLVLFILVLGLLMKGVGSIAFPDFGLIIATPLVLAVLFAAEAVAVLLSAYLLRHVSVVRLLSG